MDIKSILNRNSTIDIITLFYQIKEMPRKKKKMSIKQFKKYDGGGYEKLSIQSEELRKKRILKD